MPRRRGLDHDPRDYVASGSWPTGELVEDAPPEVEALRRLVLTLQDKMGSVSARQVASDANVPHSSVLALLAGRRFPDFVTVHRLEQVLGRLWPEP